MMVDDDDVAFLGALVHQGEEAALEVGALLPGAQVGAASSLPGVLFSGSLPSSARSPNSVVFSHSRTIGNRRLLPAR